MLRSYAISLLMNQNSTTSIDRWNSHTKEDKKPWGIIIALLVAVALHLILFIFLREIEFFQKVSDSDFETERMNVEQVTLNEPQEALPESAQTVPDLADTQETISELDDILPELKNQDIDIKAEIKDPEISIKMSTPAKLGDLEGVLDDVLLSSSSISALEEIGTGMMNNTTAAEGQIVLEEGSIDGELLDANDILDDSALKGAGGLALDGVMEGYSSLDELMSMSTLNLQGARTALPSDMLFSYDSSDLKSAARFGLLKLCMLIERNPEMYCILEGHTDTFGEDSYNIKLSEERSAAVKNYIIANLEDVGDRVIVRGYGKSRPLILDGSQEEQAPNRRVDILMRREITTEEYVPPTPVKKEPTLSPPINTAEASEPQNRRISPTPGVTPNTSRVVAPKLQPRSRNDQDRATDTRVVAPQLPPRIEERAPVIAPPTEPINRAIVVDEEEPVIPVRKAILVKPNRIPSSIALPQRAIVVDEEEQNIPRAIIVED